MNEHMERDRVLDQSSGRLFGHSSSEGEEEEPPNAAAIAWDRFRQLDSGDGDIEEDSIPFESSTMADGTPDTSFGTYTDDGSSPIFGSLLATPRGSSGSDGPAGSVGSVGSMDDIMPPGVPKHSLTDTQRRALRKLELMRIAKSSAFRPSDIVLRNQHISTEYGDSFRVVPSGLKRGQRSIQLPSGEGEEDTTESRLTKRKREAQRGIDPRQPLTEDGYLRDSERREGLASFRPKYTIEVNRRIDVLEEHDDYEFLSMMAAELDLDVNETFIKTSITRAQAAAQAVSEQISSRALARRARLGILAADLAQSREALQSLEENRSIRSSTKDDDLIRLADAIEESDDRMTALEKFMLFVLEMIVCISDIGAPNNSDFIIRAVTEDGQYLDDEVGLDDEIATRTLDLVLQKSEEKLPSDTYTFSAILFYLRHLSPASQLPGVQKVLRLYNRFRKDTRPDVSDRMKHIMVLYAAVDFLVSLALTHGLVGIPEEEEEVEEESEDTRLLVNFKHEDEDLDDHPDLRYWINNVFNPLSTDPGTVNTMKSILGRLEEKLAPEYDDDDGGNEVNNLFAFLNRDWTTGVTSRPGTEAQIQHDSTVQDIYDFVKQLYNIGDVLKILGLMWDKGSTEVTEAEEGISEGTNQAIFLFQGDDQLITNALALGVDFNPYLEDIDDPGYIDNWRKATTEYVERQRELLVNFDRAIARLTQQVEQLDADLRARETETGPLETGGITSVPITTNPEWALNPINTGILRIQRWAVSAIDQGHAHFKRYFTRVRRSEWARLKREVIQRDELMGPLFASLCATFVNRAKIGNPRRYMRDAMGRERVMRQASLMQDMLNLRLVRGNPPRFEAKRR
jgi:hypothetical protein